MAVWPQLRNVLVAVLLSGGVLRCSATQPAISWLTDHAAAVTQAQKQGKLLFVVHLSSDFTKTPLDSAEAKLYQLTALTDPRAAALLARRFVPLLVGVGETGMLRLPRTDHAASQEAAIAYVCLPDERVLHFIPGFPTSSELLQELAWTEQCYAKIARLPAAEQPLAAREAHRDMVAASDLALFLPRFASRWNEARQSGDESTVDLPAALAAARATVNQALAGRLGVATSVQRNSHSQAAGSRSAGNSEILAALAAHAGVSVDLAHLILSEFPLAPLGDLCRPAYAAAGGRRYFALPKRRAELARWWTEAASSGKPTLLVVAFDDYFVAASANPAGQNPAPQRFDGPQHVWPPLPVLALPHLRRFAVQVVTLDELSLLLADAHLGEVRYVPERPLRFLLHDARGFRIAELAGSEATIGRLAEVMKEN